MSCGSDPVADAIRLDVDLHRRLCALACRSGASQGELIGRAVAAFLALHDDFEVPSWVGAWTADAAVGDGRS